MFITYSEKSFLDKSLRCIIYLLVIVFSSCSNTDRKAEVIDIVYEWSDAHVAKDLIKLKSLYSDQVQYYGKLLSSNACIADKSRLLKKMPNFTQSISSNITVTLYQDDIYFCQFEKVVRNNKGKLKRYPSYLAIQLVSGKYRIIGESDVITDTNLGSKMEIGDVSFFEKWGALLWIIPILIGLFIYVFYQKSRAKENVVIKEVSTTHVVEHHYHDKTKSEKDGNDFEKYVVDLFQSVRFEIETWQGDKQASVKYIKGNSKPDLEVSLNMAPVKILFAVECKWRSKFYGENITWAETHQLNNYKKYEKETGRKVFVILGIAGKPSKPEELYIIPLSELNSTSVNKAFLSNFLRLKKSGFFLDVKTMTLK